MGKNKTFTKISDKAMQYASQFGSQKHLNVIRDAFALMMPFIIAGALAILLRTFIFGGMGAAQTSILGWIANSQGVINISDNGAWSFEAGTNFARASYIGDWVFASVNNATIELMAVYVAFGIGYFLSTNRQAKDPIIAGLVSVFAFFIATFAKVKLLNANGLLTAIIVGILATELYVILEKSPKLRLSLPAGVPPAVSRSFAKIFPILIIGFIIASLNVPFIIFGTYTGAFPLYHTLEASNNAPAPGSFTFGDAIYHGIQAPFMSLVGQESFGLALALIYTFGSSFIWFFGIHGRNVLNAVFTPIFYALYYENVNGANHIFVQGTFDAFITMGGSGATLGWLLAIFILGKNQAERDLAKIGVGPGIFNINEPIIFGVPMVLNLRYALPFVFCMPILTITTWAGFTLFNINAVTILIPWTTPIGVGGLLATGLDYKGLILALINFLISFGLYTPFILLGQRKHQKTKLVAKELKNEI